MPDLRKQTNPNAYLGTNDLLRRLDAAIRERDEARADLNDLNDQYQELRIEADEARAEVERLRQQNYDAAIKRAASTPEGGDDDR